MHHPKQKFYELIYGICLLVVFAINCVAVVGIDMAVNFPYPSADSVWADVGEYIPLDAIEVESLQPTLIQTGSGMQMVTVEKHFLFDRYRLLSQESVEAGSSVLLKGSSYQLRLSVHEQTIEAGSGTPMGLHLRFLRLQIPAVIFLCCLGLMVLEAVLWILFINIRES